LDVSRENEDCGLWHLLADHAGGIEPFARVGGRHPDVDDRELGSMLANEVDELGRVSALADDLEAGALEQAGHSLAQEDVVVSQHHARRDRIHTGDYGVPPDVMGISTRIGGADGLRVMDTR
jgi:hypothetical protein